MNETKTLMNRGMNVNGIPFKQVDPKRLHEVTAKAKVVVKQYNWPQIIGERKEALKRNWKEKQMYHQFLADMPDDIDQEKDWVWL